MEGHGGEEIGHLGRGMTTEPTRGDGYFTFVSW